MRKGASCFFPLTFSPRYSLALHAVHCCHAPVSVSPGGWVWAGWQLSLPAPAQSKWFFGDGTWEWRDCTVLRMSPDTGAFLVEWAATHNRKYVSRSVWAFRSPPTVRGLWQVIAELLALCSVGEAFWPDFQSEDNLGICSQPQKVVGI